MILKNEYSFPVPDEISNLQFDDVSDRAVTVKWSPPRSANGILTGYQLTYQVRDLPDSLKVHNLTAEAHRLKVEHLQVHLLNSLLHLKCSLFV